MKRKPIILILSLIIMIASTPCSIFAAEGPLYVYDGIADADHLLKEYSFTDLQDLWQAEGRKPYKYSGYNTLANYKTLVEDNEQSAKGPTVLGILEDAGIDTSGLTENDSVKFLAADGRSLRLTYGQLTEERYYFPSGNTGTAKGAKGDDASRAGAVVVPAIIDLAHTKKSSSLRIGQIAPNEQTWPAHNHYMTDTKGGKIIIQRDGTSQEPATLTASPKSGATVVPNQTISINGGSHYVKVYYTTDGSVPSLNSDIYNYISNTDDGRTPLNRSIIVSNNVGTDFTIKCFKYRYGYFNSNIQSFTYKVVSVTSHNHTVNGQKYKATKAATASARGTARFVKSKNAKSVTVPKAVKLKDRRYYNVTAVAARAFTYAKVRNVTIASNVTTLKPYAFKNSRATKIFIKTKNLKKSTVKNSLKGSKVQTIVVNVGTKKINKTYVTKYKKFFTKANAGRKVTVRIAL